MWEIVAFSLECQRAAFDAHARGLKLLQETTAAGLSTNKAVEANAKALTGWWRLWGGR